MPLYFLHMTVGGQMIEDPEGGEMSDLHSAKAEAVARIRELLAERVFAGHPLTDDEMRIADETGQVLAVVPFPRRRQSGLKRLRPPQRTGRALDIWRDCGALAASVNTAGMDGRSPVPLLMVRVNSRIALSQAGEAASAARASFVRLHPALLRQWPRPSPCTF